MTSIVLKVFGGMVPRRGEQHLEMVSATEAENTRLYSGELRPLNKPALAHTFSQPDDPEFIQPPTTTLPPIDPEGPIPGLGYDPDAYCDVVLSLLPEGYWKFDDAHGSGTIADYSGNGHHLTVYGAEQVGEQPPFIDDNRTSWQSQQGLVVSPATPPERIGLNNSDLVPEGGASWWCIFGEPWGYSNVMRVDVSNDSLFRIQYRPDTGDFWLWLYTPEISKFSPAVYKLGGATISTGSPKVFGLNFNSTFNTFTAYIDFVQQPKVTLTHTFVFGAAAEQVFSFAEYGNVRMQHGFCMTKELNENEVALLEDGYNRNFLSYVIPPA